MDKMKCSNLAVKIISLECLKGPDPSQTIKKKVKANQIYNLKVIIKLFVNQTWSHHYMNKWRFFKTASTMIKIFVKENCIPFLWSRGQRQKINGWREKSCRTLRIKAKLMNIGQNNKRWRTKSCKPKYLIYKNNWKIKKMNTIRMISKK